MEVYLDDPGELYNSLDASPRYDRELNARTEAFIVSWADELPRGAAPSLVLHLQNCPDSPVQRAAIVRGIHQHFRQLAHLQSLALRALLGQGRITLLLGLTILTLSLMGSEALLATGASIWTQLVSQALATAGWVAMWRPLQIYLYDWWPVVRKRRDYRRLSQMPIELRRKDGHPHGNP
jgi:hypothetical protein